MSFRDKVLLMGKVTQLATLTSKVQNFRKRLNSFCDSLEEDTTIKYTGYFVLLKQESDGWKSLGVYNPDKDENVNEPEWDIALAIPTKESIKEFRGW